MIKIVSHVNFGMTSFFIPAAHLLPSCHSPNHTTGSLAKPCGEITQDGGHSTPIVPYSKVHYLRHCLNIVAYKQSRAQREQNPYFFPVANTKTGKNIISCAQRDKNGHFFPVANSRMCILAFRTFTWNTNPCFKAL